MTISNPESSGLHGVLLRELHHRATYGIAFAINLVSAAAIRVERTEAKGALSDVVELLHGYADVHRALAMPAGDTLTHAATSIRNLGCGMRRAVHPQRCSDTTVSPPLRSRSALRTRPALRGPARH
ncbi:hypothetical protein [Bradyrhizobium sp. USDA 4486]